MVHGKGMLSSVLILGLALLAASVSASDSHPQVMHDPIGAIEVDYAAGKLSADQRALLVVQAIKHPVELPAEYQLFDPSTGRSDSRSATIALRDIRVNWNLLTPETQASIDEALTRWSTAYTYDEPSGFFKLHYDITGTNAVPSADLDSDGVPDYVEKCAAYCDSSLSKHLQLGYLPPPSDGTRGGDSKFDVYFENMGYYGYADPEGPGSEPWNDYYSYLVLHNTYLGFPPNDDPEGDVAGAAKATAAHEFHHCIQFAYDATEASWFMELDATYMEDIVYDQVNDNYNYLPDFMNDPEISLMANTIHMYACFVYGMYMAEQFDTSLMRAVWEGARYSATVFNTMSDTLVGRYGWTQDSAFADFVTWNYMTGSRNDGNHYGEGGSYPAVMIDRTHNAYPVATTTSPRSPAGYASTYVQFLPGTSSGSLRLVFDGNDSRQWAAFIIKSHGSTSHEVEKLLLSPTTYLDTIEIPDFQTYSSVTLVGANIMENSSAASFTYSAIVRQPYALASQLLSDTLVYAGAPRTFSYKVKNTSALNDVVRVIGNDSWGWLPADTVTQFLYPGDSLTADFLVMAPLGIAVGSTSPLRFRAMSVNDTTVQTQRLTTGVTVLQVGDADFNGAIDIGDLSWLVDYLFENGQSPRPVLGSGDFDCIGSVDIGDLTQMVEYLFSVGPGPACNPF